MPPPMGASGDSACNSIFELTALGCVDVVWLQSGASVDEILDRKKDTVGVLKEHADKLSRLIQEGLSDNRFGRNGRSRISTNGRPRLSHELGGPAINPPSFVRSRHLR